MTFAQTGLSAHLLQALEKEGFTTPTPVQEQAIPKILAGESLVGVAQTGTGKTLAFALPLIERLQDTEDTAVILVPTRELAMQLDKSIRKFSKGLVRMNPSLLVTAGALDNQADSLKKRPHLVIATPGRLNDHLDHGTFSLRGVTAIVLDEADRMLGSGLAPQIERILDRAPKKRQTLMFSATMPGSVARLVARYAPDATRLEITAALEDTSLIDQSVYKIGITRRLALLTLLLHQTTGKVIVFTPSKSVAQKLYKAVHTAGFSVAGLHGDRTVAGRDEAIDGFRKNRYQILITTDLASRGIDIPAVSLVINYDVPVETETYVHRIGRTGRAGATGKAITFVMPEQQKRMQRIEEELGRSIPIVQKPGTAHT